MRLLYLILLPLLLTACIEDRCENTVTFRSYTPVTITAAEWRTDAFTPAPAGTVCDPSGFYVYGDYLLILDRNEGLHLIDNSDNANPRPVSFVPIRGGTGLAVRNNVLYVNQYIDLLAFDLTSPASPRFLSRTEDVFDPSSVFSWGMESNGNYIVAYTEGTEIREEPCTSPYYNRGWYLDSSGAIYATHAGIVNNIAPLTGQQETVGQGGSLARFTISQGTLYAVDDNSLRTFSLEQPTAPEFLGTSQLPYGVETIFPAGDKLYIGSTTGLHIYGVDNPLAPEYLSTFAHVRSCDPVVVQGDLAYVTMWGGSSCGNVGDQLMVLNVSDPRNPVSVQEMPMVNSHGLGVDGDRLFLCSGTDGIRVYALEADGRVGKQVHQDSGFNAKDVIVLSGQNRLIALGWEQAGIEQYNYSADGALSTVSHFSVCD